MKGVDGPIRSPSILLFQSNWVIQGVGRVARTTVPLSFIFRGPSINFRFSLVRNQKSKVESTDATTWAKGVLPAFSFGSKGLVQHSSPKG